MLANHLVLILIFCTCKRLLICQSVCISKCKPHQTSTDITLQNVFLSFLSLSVGHFDLPPETFPDQAIAEKNSSEYLFMSCINYINKVIIMIRYLQLSCVLYMCTLQVHAVFIATGVLYLCIIFT